MIIITYVKEFEDCYNDGTLKDMGESDFSIKYFSSEDSAAIFIAETELENKDSKTQHILINYLSDLEEIAELDLFGRDIEFHGSNMDLHYAQDSEYRYCGYYHHDNDYDDMSYENGTEINRSMAIRITDLAKKYYQILKQER